MKQKISITLNQETIELVENLSTEPQFRNRSHVIEFALSKLAEERE